MTIDNVTVAFDVDERSGNNFDIGRSPWNIDALIQVADRIIASDPQLFALAQIGTNKRLNVRLVRDYAVRGLIPAPNLLRRKSRFGLPHLLHLLAVRVLLGSQKWSLRVIKANLTTTTPQDLLNGLLSPVKVRVQAEYAEAAGLVSGAAECSPDAVSKTCLNAITGATTLLTLQSSAATDKRRAAKSKMHIELEPWCEVVIDAHRLRLLTWAEVDRLTKTLQDHLKVYTPQVRRTRHMSNSEVD